MIPTGFLITIFCNFPRNYWTLKILNPEAFDMQYDKIAKSYKAQSVQTASPGKLVLMLFDGYLRFTTAAKNAFNEEDLTKKNEGINNNLIRAQNIVTELQSS